MKRRCVDPELAGFAGVSREGLATRRIVFRPADRAFDVLERGRRILRSNIKVLSRKLTRRDVEELSASNDRRLLI